MLAPGNVPDLAAQRAMELNNAMQARALGRLATGLRINRAADDPAGLIASENLRGALAALEAETRALQRTDSVASRAEGALTEISDLLVEAEGIAVARANTGALGEGEAEALQLEMDSIVQTIDRIASTTTFNGQRRLDGELTLRAGDTSLDIADVSTSSLGATTIDGVDVALGDLLAGGALASGGGLEGDGQSVLAAAQDAVASLRGRIGAFQRNVIAPALESSMVAIENTAAAESVIRDADFAAEVASLSRAGTLGQASAAMFGLALTLPETALGLLGPPT